MRTGHKHNEGSWADIHWAHGSVSWFKIIVVIITKPYINVAIITERPEHTGNSNRWVGETGGKEREKSTQLETRKTVKTTCLTRTRFICIEFRFHTLSLFYS